MKQKLTKKGVDALTCNNANGREFIQDRDCRGLLIEIRSTGNKTYYFSYRDERGKQRKYKLANASDVSPSQARQLCERARSQLMMGINVQEEKVQKRNALTLDAFFNNQYLPYVQSYKRSWKIDISAYKNHIQPLLGSQYIDTIGSAQVLEVLNAASKTLCDGTINRLLVLLRYMFNLALQWKIAGIHSNPTASYKLKKLSNHRERFLTAQETQLLMTQVNASQNTMLKYIIPMLLLTGARKHEVQDARWEDIDFERKFWRIPSTKSGHERHVPLSPAAIALLNQVPKNCDYIFANPKTLKPFITFFYSWDTARKRAGLKEVRMHDLRHSFASFLINAGCGLYEVQKLLGHSSTAMTQRYSHLSQDSLMRAVSCAEPYLEVS
ncbi:MAG: tyrosine-type recombinase/integrase [Methylococcales bacterium]|jgi:integrase|nr:tyrosine-type recombinase/integrase [Methylococcales bacterium]